MAGSVEERKNGSYLLTYSMGFNAQGKRIRKRKTVKAKNMTEAKKKLAAFVTEIEQGEYIDPSKVKFIDFVDEWKDKEAVNHLSPKTLESYMYIINRYMIPTFSHLRMDAIKMQHIRDYLESLKTKRNDGKEGGLSSASIHYHHRVLSNLFKYAVQCGIIKKSPVDDVRKPKIESKGTEVYTTEEVHELFSLLRDQVIHQRLIVSLAVTTGLRRNEILGLTWNDIDYDGNVIHVRHSLHYTNTTEYELGAPKTKTSIRKVAPPPGLMAELKMYHRERMKDRLKLAELWEGGEHFFVFSNNGKPFHPNTVTRWWNRFTDRTDFKKIRFHDLRHTAATLLISKGHHAKTISERLGHSKINTTMDIYGHYIQEADQKAGEDMDEFFTPTRTEVKAPI